jgi:hypothetical protein
LRIERQFLPHHWSEMLARPLLTSVIDDRPAAWPLA